MACSAYMPEHQSLGSAVAGSLGLTAIFAVLISLAVLPTLLDANVEIAQGAPSIFLNLPLAFGAGVNGDYYGSLFFLIVALIIFCSALVLLEPIVSWLERVLSVPRYVAAFAGGGLVWLLTVIVSLSFNEWSQIHIVGSLTPYGFVEVLTSYVLVPALVMLNGWLFVALLRSPMYSKQGSNQFLLPVRVLARLHVAYISPLIVVGIVWFSVRNRVFF